MASGTLLTEQEMNQFRSEYGELIRQQCVLLIGNTESAKELEEQVYRSIREKYEYRPLPEHCETMLIAQCCILSSQMDAPEAEDLLIARLQAPQIPKAKTAKAQREPESIPEKVPENILEDVPKDISESIPQYLPQNTPIDIPEKTSESIPQNISGSAPENSPESIPEKASENVSESIQEKAPENPPKSIQENIPEEIRNIRVTATYDPEKTAVWFPDGLEPDRVHEQKDPEDPEELTSERNVAHSIVNTFLAISFLGSIGFFMWKTGILRWVKRFLEDLFIYG